MFDQLDISDERPIICMSSMYINNLSGSEMAIKRYNWIYRIETGEFRWIIVPNSNILTVNNGMSSSSNYIDFVDEESKHYLIIKATPFFMRYSLKMDDPCTIKKYVL